MTQDQCLQTPHHWTHYGVCHVGDANLQLHGLSMGGTTGVPEPSTFVLMLLALIINGAWLRCRYRSG